MKICLKCKYADVSDCERTIKYSNNVTITQKGKCNLICKCPNIKNIKLSNGDVVSCSSFEE